MSVNPVIVSDVEEALRRGGASTRGREWVFTCPAHDDKHPSARYNPEKQTWWCHCGAKGGVIDLANRLGVQLPEMPMKVGPSNTADYVYRDEGSNELFRVHKSVDLDGRKRFWQSRPGGGTDLTGVRRVPYNLPLLIETPVAHPVFIVEGEKDADRLISHGLVATCNPGGAGKWRDEYSTVLVGHPIVIIADNDTVGREHAEAVRKSLLAAGQPADMIAVDTVSQIDKGDVSDFLDAGGTVATLLALVPKPAEDWTHVYDVLTMERPARKVVPTGFRDLDALTNGGLRGGQLIIIASRPSVGKSALGAGIAYHVAAAGGLVAFASLEMTEEEVANRIARYGPVSVDERVYINDEAGLSIDQLTSMVERLHARNQLDMVIVDYLQLMTGGTGNRANDVGLMTVGLKNLAKRLSIPIIALCQLNREVEKRGDGDGPRRYKLSDLRESGNIEQDADIVAFLDREEMYDPASLSRGTAVLQVAKHREGARSDLVFGYHAAGTLFYDLAIA